MAQPRRSRAASTLVALICLGTTVASGDAATFASVTRTQQMRRRLPSISVNVSPSTVSAGGTVRFTVRTSKADSVNNTSVSYVMAGTAVAGRDYISPSGSVVIPAGATSASVALNTMGTGGDTTRVATLRLQSGANYKISTPSRSSVTIRPATATPTPTAAPSATPTPVPTPTPTPTARPSPEQEIWVSLRSDGLPGNGTQSDPFDGSTQPKFDAVMLSIPANTAIHLGPGTFRTAAAHSWLVRPGWIVTGAGIDMTTIRLTGSVAGVLGVSCFYSDSNISSDNVTISDLTIDCNWPELSQTAPIGDKGEAETAVAAAYIFGSNNVIERVRFTNPYGSWFNATESFGIAFASPVNADATGNVIRFCRADSPHGNYGSPFALHGRVGHPISNSMVMFNTAVGINDGFSDGFTTGGVNLAYHQNCTVEGNTFTDCFGIAYQDAGTLNNLTVRNNVAVRAWYGVGITLSNASWTADGVTITNNNINVQNRVAGKASYGVIFGGSEIVVTNVLIESNNFTTDTAGVGLNDIQIITDYTKLNNAHARIQNNVTDDHPSRVTSGGVCFFNNRTSDGRQSLGLLDNTNTACQ